MRCLRRLGLAVVPLALFLVAGNASAAETWGVQSGRIVIHFTDSYMDLLGLSLVDVDQTGAIPEPYSVNMEPPYRSFQIASPSAFTFGVNFTSFVPGSFGDGAMVAQGGLSLVDAASGVRQDLRDFSIEAGAEGESFIMRDAASGRAVFELQYPSVVFDRESSRLVAGGMTVALTPQYAERIGRPELAGRGVGIALIETDVVYSSGDSEGEPYQEHLTGTFKDVSLGILDGIIEWDRAGTYPDGISALSMATTSCNLGDQDVPWHAPMATDHPGIVMCLYRSMNGAFEQVGVSFVKHGFYALSGSQCIPCQHPSDGSFLGVGCSDTYGSGNNADRYYLGERREWNPFAGTWDCVGSHFSGGVADCVRRHGSSGHGPTDHRVEVHDGDMNNPGATYYYEAYYMVRGDQNKPNNIASRPCTMSWAGSHWNIGNSGAQVQGPALVTRWDGDVTYADIGGSLDGQAIISVKTTSIGGGDYHYEYAVFNFDSERRIRSFSIPVGATNVTNMGFHDGDIIDGNEWTVSLADGNLTWETPAYGDPGAHPMEPGYLFNFRFDADQPPVDGTVTMGLYTPGAPTSSSASTTVPQSVATSVSPLEGGAHTLRLAQNQPNPLHLSTTIHFELPAASDVRLDIFDASGRRVRSLVNESRAAGVYDVRWNRTDDNGKSVAPGVYYYRMQAAGEVQARSMIVVQ